MLFCGSLVPAMGRHIGDSDGPLLTERLVRRWSTAIPTDLAKFLLRPASCHQKSKPHAVSD
jgi:hypothetical protein